MPFCAHLPPFVMSVLAEAVFQLVIGTRDGQIGITMEQARLVTAGHLQEVNYWRVNATVVDISNACSRYSERSTGKPGIVCIRAWLSYTLHDWPDDQTCRQPQRRSFAFSWWYAAGAGAGIRTRSRAEQVQRAGDI
jgi:hypothetical protein